MAKAREKQDKLENVENEAGTFKILPSARSLVAAIGYAAVTASMFLVIVCGTVQESAGVGAEVEIHPARLVGMLAMLVTLLIGYVFSDKFTAFGYRQTNQIGTVVSVLDLAAMAGVEYAFGLHPWFEAVSSAVFGIAIALVFVSWGRLLREIPKEEILQTQSTVFCVAGLLFVFAMFSSDVAKLLASLLYLAGGCALFFVFARGLGVMDPPDRERSKEQLEFDWRSSLSYAVTGFAIGLVPVILWWSIGRLPGSIVFGLGFVTASVVSMVISRYKGPSWVLLGPVERWTFPFIVCILLLMIAIGPLEVQSAVLGVVLFCVLMVRDISRAVTRQVLASEYEVQPVYLYTRATLPETAGIALGALVGTGLAVLQNTEYVTWTFCALVGVFAITATIVPYGQDKLVMPTIKAAEGQEAPASEDLLESEWARGCEAICERYGLTPREKDVFGLLARGRTAKVIARDLTISEHTVKSHTYNIYRKLGINSQQELIDMTVQALQELEEERSGEKERLGKH